MKNLVQLITLMSRNSLAVTTCKAKGLNINDVIIKTLSKLHDNCDKYSLKAIEDLIIAEIVADKDADLNYNFIIATAKK